MAEPTNTQLLDAITDLRVQVDNLVTIVQDVQSSLTLHRQDSETRTTNLDVGLRDELALVRAHVDAFQPQLDEVKSKQTAGDQAVAALNTLVENLHVQTDAIKVDITTLGPKIDAVRSKQDEIIAAQSEPTP